MVNNLNIVVGNVNGYYIVYKNKVELSMLFVLEFENVMILIMLDGKIIKLKDIVMVEFDKY